MLEIKVSIEVTAPDLSAAIEKLAAAWEGATILRSEGVQTRPSEAQTAADASAENAPSPQSVFAQVQPGQLVQSVPVQLVQSVPVQPVQSVPVQPVQSVPVRPGQLVQSVPVQQPIQAEAPAIDLETISRAGAALIDQGKMVDVLSVLKKYGVPAVNQLDPGQYQAFANDLKALGANI